MRLILASQSPRRQQLLQLLRVSFTVCPADIDEGMDPSLLPQNEVARVSKLKAEATIRNPEIRKGLTISFDPKDFPCMVQWNKFSWRDYALGLEPRSTRYGGRAATKAQGEDTSLAPGTRSTFRVTVDFFTF